MNVLADLGLQPASVAQLATHPTGDQEVVSLTPAGSLVELIMEYFLLYSLPSVDSRMAFVSFWRKNVHNTG